MPSKASESPYPNRASDIIWKQFKDIPFVISRYDTDITVLPIKYLDETRLIPRHKLNGKKAQINVSTLQCADFGDI